jgi:hypothetical protein
MRYLLIPRILFVLNRVLDHLIKVNLHLMILWLAQDSMSTVVMMVTLAFMLK